MSFFKKFILTLASCCVVLCSCGRTDNNSDSDMPDGIVNIEATTEPADNKTEDTDSQVTTTAPAVNMEIVWTTTTVKKGRPYNAQAHNNYTPQQTAVRTTVKSKTTSKRLITTAKRPTVTGTGSGKYVPGTASATVTSITTRTSIKKTTVSATNVTTTAKPAHKELSEQMTLKDKVCQMFIVAPEQLSGGSKYLTEADKNLKNGLKNYPVGGILFSEENLESKAQITAMLRNLQIASKDAGGVGIFTVIQEEGGSYAPAANKLGTSNPGSMLSLGENKNEEAVYKAGKDIGTELNKLGFNVNLAPVADLETNSKNGLGDRVFSSDADIAAKMVSKLVKGLSDAGMESVLSHFPGVGAYDGKSALIKRSLSQLRSEEFLPFKSGINAGADFVLVSHHTISGIGDNLPCDLSYSAVTGILRNELGFKGIVITDSHKDPSITKKYSVGEAAVMAINAGADIVLMPDDLSEAVNSVCEAVENGEIREERINESAERILEMKAEMGLL